MKFMVIAIGYAAMSVVPCLAARPFTVKDSIEVARFDNEALDVNDGYTQSPDGHHLIAVTKRRLLQSDTIESTAWLFDAEEIVRFVHDSRTTRKPKAKVLARMSSAWNAHPINRVRWSTTGAEVLFIGSDGALEPRLFAVNTADSQLRQLSPSGQAVTSFDKTGSFVAFLSGQAIPENSRYGTGVGDYPDVEIGSGASLFTLLFPRFEQTVFGMEPQHLWLIRDREPVETKNVDTSEPVVLVGRSYLPILSVSPDGRYAIAVSSVPEVGAGWEGLEPANGYPKLEARSRKSLGFGDLLPVEYVLIQLETGRTSSLLRAPLGSSGGYYSDAFKVRWSPRRLEVAVSNTYMLPAGETTAGPPKRPCIAVVDIAAGRSECVKETSDDGGGSGPLTNIEWRNQGRELVARYYMRDAVRCEEHFQHLNGLWTSFDDCKKPKPRSFIVAVQEDLDHPPVLKATDARTGQTKVLLDPNPQLADVEFGNTTKFQWSDHVGHNWTAGLVKPPKRAQPNQPYPLVIQTHGFDPSVFLTDGPYPTANAARALAARGIAVLQVAEPKTALFSPDDATVNGRFGYESAIERLAADRRIDAKRLGITGFSYTGLHVLETLIHSSTHFSAATLAEASTGTMEEYLLNADYRGPQQIRAVIGGIGTIPFGSGLAAWLSKSPGFHTEQIRTPVLFEENSPPALLYNWDLYAALRLQSKAVELLYVRDGEHVLEKPSQIFVSQTSTVDWYDFWLNGHEDADPIKADQYRRWEKLCDRQVEQNPDLQAICVRSRLH